MDFLHRSTWDVVVGIIHADPLLGYIDGVVVTGTKRDKRTIRVRDHRHPPDLVESVVEDMRRAEAGEPGVKVPLLGYRGGEVPTYYALIDELEVLEG